MSLNDGWEFIFEFDFCVGGFVLGFCEPVKGVLVLLSSLLLLGVVFEWNMHTGCLVHSVK